MVTFTDPGMIPATPPVTAPLPIQLEHRNMVVQLLTADQSSSEKPGHDKAPEATAHPELTDGLWREMERIDARIDRQLRRRPLPALPASPAEIDPRLSAMPAAYQDGAVCAAVAERAARLPLRRRPRFIVVGQHRILRVEDWYGDRPIARSVEGHAVQVERWLPMTAAHLELLKVEPSLIEQVVLGAWALEWRAASRAGWGGLYERWLADLDGVSGGKISIDNAIGRYVAAAGRLVERLPGRKPPRGVSVDEFRRRERERVRRWRDARKEALASAA